MKSYNQFLSEMKLHLNCLKYGTPTASHKERMDTHTDRFSDEVFEHATMGGPPPNDSELVRKELYHLRELAGHRDIDLFERYDHEFSDDIIEYAEDNNLEYDAEEFQELIEQSSDLVLRIKYHFNRPRPSQLAAVYGMELNQMRTKSGHTPSYPSGHSAQSRFLAQVLAEDNPDHAEALMDMAEEIGRSRVEGGVHYPSDHEFGVKVGDMLFKDYMGEDLHESVEMEDGKYVTVKQFSSEDAAMSSIEDAEGLVDHMKVMDSVYAMVFDSEDHKEKFVKDHDFNLVEGCGCDDCSGSLDEAEYQGKKVTLNKPFRTPGESKKFAVYAKNESGKVVIVRFGDPNMEIKRDDPKRLKAYRSRMGCDTNPGPKWKANYWSCYQWRAGAKVDD